MEEGIKAWSKGWSHIRNSTERWRWTGGKKEKKKKQKGLQVWLHLRAICYSHQTVSTQFSFLRGWISLGQGSDLLMLSWSWNSKPFEAGPSQTLTSKQLPHKYEMQKTQLLKKSVCQRIPLNLSPDGFSRVAHWEAAKLAQGCFSTGFTAARSASLDPHRYSGE